MSQAPLRFDGPAYEPEKDDARLSDQHRRIKALMLDGQWRTIREIARKTADPEASVSAQLRHLRKPRFGGYTVERRQRGERKSGLYEYRLLPPGTGSISEKKRPRSYFDLLSEIAILKAKLAELEAQ